MTMTTSEDQGRLVDTLRNLGLTNYEARVYIGLLGVSGATATEIHELSNVPRASVYSALDLLIQKNLVSISHTAPRRFRAISPTEGINHLLGRIQADAGEAKKSLEKLHAKQMKENRAEQELIWSIFGKENIIDRLGDLIAPAHEEVRLIAHWYLLREGIAQALCRLSPDVDVEVICDRWEGGVGPNLSIRIAPVPVERDYIPQHDMAGVFLFDKKQAMVIMGTMDETPSALFSESAGFVQFFYRYYRFIHEWLQRTAQ